MVGSYLFKARDGQTPLPLEFQKDLIPTGIQTMGDLDEYEENNISLGLVWLEEYEKDPINYLFWIELHKHLFNKVWKWAGKIRTHELNNPDFLEPHKISSELLRLEGDLRFWIENRSFCFKEIAARFHERIETIHAFPNGNGRHGRILTEYICKRSKEDIPTWGKSMQNEPSARRKAYIGAVVEAQNTKNYKNLLNIMFS